MPEARVIQLRPDDDPYIPPSAPPGWEEQLAGGLEFLRRRVTGDYATDEFGFDPDLTDHLLLPLLRPLYEKWFRVETQGLENVPSGGGALVVANHSGTIPADALMTTVALHDDHPARRRLRLLGADLVFDLPLIGSMSRKMGSTLACNEDAERLLTEGELVGVDLKLRGRRLTGRKRHRPRAARADDYGRTRSRRRWQPKSKPR